LDVQNGKKHRSDLLGPEKSVYNIKLKIDPNLMLKLWFVQHYNKYTVSEKAMKKYLIEMGVIKGFRSSRRTEKQ